MYLLRKSEIFEIFLNNREKYTYNIISFQNARALYYSIVNVTILKLDKVR